MAKVALSTVPIGSTLIDENTSFEGETLKWVVAAHNTDGTGITTLILDPFQAYDINSNKDYINAWDAKEPNNPTEGRAENGNPSYKLSNLLQFLNSDGLGGSWYQAQHEYDEAPTDEYVYEGNHGYADRDAFLAHFGSDFKNAMQSVTKNGVSRKVHLPGYAELLPTTTYHETDDDTLGTFDKGVGYKACFNTGIQAGYSTFRFIVRGECGSNASSWTKTYCPTPILQVAKDDNYNDYRKYKLVRGHSPCSGYGAYGIIAPAVYVNSSTNVVLDGDVYYTSFPSVPTITTKDDYRSHTFAFDVKFQVHEPDRDTIISNVSIDGTQYYTNNNTPLDTDVTATIPSDVFTPLSLGTHTITITASDGENTVTATSKFYKSATEMVTLESVSESKIFVDRNTKYNGEPIEWFIAAKHIEGEEIIALIKDTAISEHCYDAKEVNNPDSDLANYGNGDYATSNILQWLNSEESDWYVAQHPYDYPPNSDTVGGTYASEDGFLHNFSEELLSAMNTVDKMDVARRVHIPSYTEFIGTATVYWGSAYQTNFDDKEIYNYRDSEWRNTVLFSRSKYKSKAGYVRYDKTNYRYAGGAQDAYASKLHFYPTIYVRGADIPVTYDAETQKYYLDYGFEVRYADYGKHKSGFDFEVKLSGSTVSGVTTIKAYIDNALAQTFEVETYNAYVTLRFSDAVISALASEPHTVRLEASTYGISASDTFSFTKVAESVPVVLTNAIGHVAETFSTVYRVFDEDGDSLDVTIKLNGSVLNTYHDVEQNTDLTYSLPVATFNALVYGEHTLSISATDGTNIVTNDIRFTKNSIPSVVLQSHDLGEIVQPTSVNVDYSSADGDNITIKAYIDNQEINA